MAGALRNQAGGHVCPETFIPVGKHHGVVLLGDNFLMNYQSVFLLLPTLPHAREETWPHVWGTIVPFLIGAVTSPGVHQTIIWALKILTKLKGIKPA